MNSPYIERLVFDEILANQITLQIIKEKNKIKSCGCYSKTRIIEFNKKYTCFDL